MGKRVIVDFDNTMGVRGCDVDDGLALLYLLGCPDVQVEGICTTYGNNKLDVVHANTLHLVEEWGLDVPVYRGGEFGSAPEGNEAARFIADATRKDPEQVSVIATGSMTNLGCARDLDPDALNRAEGLYLMGGITESLVINGHIMDELNLSCDARAARATLSAACPVHVATAQNCMPAFFSKDDLERTFGSDSWMTRTCAYWFSDMEDAYLWDGWVCWDVVTAAYAVHPELFEDAPFNVTLNETLLGVGYLERAREGAPAARINAPVIKNPAAFKQNVLTAWKRAVDRLGLD